MLPKKTQVPPRSVRWDNGSSALEPNPLDGCDCDRLSEALTRRGYVLYTLTHPAHAAPLVIGMNLDRRPADFPVVVVMAFPSPAKVAWLRGRDNFHALARNLWPAAPAPAYGGSWKWTDGFPAEFDLRLRGEAGELEAAASKWRDSQNTAARALARLNREVRAARRRWQSRNEA